MLTTFPSNWKKKDPLSEYEVGSRCYIRQVVSFLFIHWIPNPQRATNTLTQTHLSWQALRTDLRDDARQDKATENMATLCFTTMAFQQSLEWQMSDGEKHFSD